MALSARFTRRTRRPSSATPYPVRSGTARSRFRGSRLVALFVAPLAVDLDVGTVVLNAAEIEGDLASAFERGPYTSIARAVAPAALSEGAPLLTLASRS